MTSFWDPSTCGEDAWSCFTVMYCIDIFGCNYNNICHTTFQSIILINEMRFYLFVSFCLSISIGYTLWYCGIHVIIVYQINLKSDIVIEEKNKQRKPSLLIAMLSLIFASNYLLVLSSSTDSRQFILAPIDFLSELAFSFDDYMFGPHLTAQSS